MCVSRWRDRRKVRVGLRHRGYLDVRLGYVVQQVVEQLVLNGSPQRIRLLVLILLKSWTLAFEPLTKARTRTAVCTHAILQDIKFIISIVREVRVEIGKGRGLR